MALGHPVDIGSQGHAWLRSKRGALAGLMLPTSTIPRQRLKFKLE